MVGFMTFAHGFESSGTVSACGSCHVMTPFVRDLQDPKSNTLAATRFKNRFILRNLRYECHSDYAKLSGVGHVFALHDRELHAADQDRQAVPELRVSGMPRRVAAIPDRISRSVPLERREGLDVRARLDRFLVLTNMEVECAETQSRRMWADSLRLCR
jgi:hypothetical protein